MRKSRLSTAKQARLMEHFVAGTTARCAAALFGVILIVNSSWLVLGAFLARLSRHPRSGRAINLLFALLLVLSVVMATSI